LIGPEVGAVFANGTQYLTVEAWRDGTSFGENSISKQPTFTAFDDLHLAECSVVDDELRGVSEPLVVVDFDDESRDPLAPFMGADEPQGGPPPVFTGPGVYSAGTGSFQFDSGDLNGDGYADIVVTNPGAAAGGSGANDVTVLLNNGNGNFGAPTHLPFGDDPSSIRIGFINDGDTPDIVVRADDGVWFRLGVPGGSFTDPIQVGTLGTNDLELADYDNDGDTDIFVVSAPPGEPSSVVVFINDGNGVFSGFSDFEVISTDTVTDVELADVNDDGFVDVLAVEATGAGKFLVLENLGIQAPGVSRGFADPAEYAFSLTSDPSRSRFAVGDFDGDLDVDVILGAAAGGDSLVLVRNNGAGVYGDRHAFDVHFSGVPEVVAALDYERDGDLDLVAASSGSTVDLMLNRGDGSFERVILCNNGALVGFPIGIVTGPIDDDMSTDVAVLSFEGAVDGRVEVLYNLEWRPSGTAIEPPGGQVRVGASLSPNYPNPFLTATTIPFELDRSGPVELSVFDLLGRRVATILDDIRSGGKHTVRFDASGLASGVYFYRISSGGFVDTRRMILVR
ncbi:MAG: T9SS type A sorting domain-containing protein, partial [Rhodothermales bacterium]|nr:T9SS type A sorting domain-containing protein [Rhodothermales bacterium]